MTEGRCDGKNRQWIIARSAWACIFIGLPHFYYTSKLKNHLESDSDSPSAGLNQQGETDRINPQGKKDGIFEKDQEGILDAYRPRC